MTVNGDLTAINTSVVEVEDATLLLGKNNPADSIDFGIIGQYVESGTTKFTGIYRDASSTNQHYELFKSLEEKPTTTVNTAGAGYERAELRVSGLDVQNAITFSQPDAGIIHQGITLDGGAQKIYLNTKH